MLKSYIVRRFLPNSTKEFRMLKTCYNACFIHFNPSDALNSCRQIDTYFKHLDNSFVERTRLQTMQEMLDLPTTDKYFKIHFWPKFISSTIINKKDKILQSLILYILEKAEVHSTPTLLAILKTLASQHRFEEFESLYILIKSRLSSTDTIVYSADLSGALCLTPFYEEAMAYLHLSLDHNLPIVSFARILTAAATFGPLDEAISLLHKFYSIGLKPDPEFYTAFIKRLDESNGVHLMISLLEAVRKYNYIITNSVALLLKEWFGRLGWKGTMGVYLSRLSCSSCLKYLDKVQIDSETCNQLAEIFYNDVLKGKTSDELFLTTTPKELESFSIFLEANKTLRFDCVIDLPNYLHTVTHRKLFKMSIEEQVGLLSDLLLILHRTYHFKRFCLVGKERAVVKKRQFWDVIKALGNRTGINVQTFLVDHRSNDDAFMMYLALWSGPDCHLLSIDEFRQHRYTIGPEGADLLAKWQTARQLSIKSFHPLAFNDSVICDPRVQGNMKDGWHIPYDSGEPRLSYLPPTVWLCLQPPTRFST
nr:mitochondrial ribonuclease P protein 3 [Hymenolepis microstoma]